MPKVLRIINRLNLGGPTFNAAYLTKYLPAEFETLLVAGTHQQSEESSEFIVQDLGLNYIQLPEMSREINYSKDRIAYKKIKKLMRDFKPDIVHTHAAKAGTLGRLAASSLKIPVVLHTFHGHVFHSYFNPLKTKIFLNIERYLAKKSSAIIAISEQQKYELGTVHRLCKPEKIKMIPLGFDLSKFQNNVEEKRKDFRKKYLICEDELTIGIIGRLVPVKNHKLFLQSLKYVLENTAKKVRAFIIGDGEDRLKVEAMARELEIDFVDFMKEEKAATLTFTSWIKNIDWAIAGLDIITMTSFNEGTPVSLIEAQAGNKPIVSTNVGGIESVVIKNVTALLSESDDAESLSRNLLRVVEDDKLRKEMSEAGWENVKEKFHYTRLCRDMSALYHELLTTKKI